MPNQLLGTQRTVLAWVINDCRRLPSKSNPPNHALNSRPKILCPRGSGYACPAGGDRASERHHSSGHRGGGWGGIGVCAGGGIGVYKGGGASGYLGLIYPSASLNEQAALAWCFVARAIKGCEYLQSLRIRIPMPQKAIGR